MGINAGDVFLDVHPSLSSFNKELGTRLAGLRGTAQKIVAPFGLSVGQALGAGIAGGVGLLAAKTIGAFKVAEQVSAQTGAVIASTGAAAGVSATEVEDLAEKLAILVGTDDEAVQASENLLLTFRQIADEEGPANTFERTETAILDMATAMNSGAIPTLEDLRSTTIQVGKAVNDPIKGFTALQRVGVTFTQSQRDTVKAMIEANDLMGAQDVILSELEAEFGGAAKAAGQTFGGEMGRLSKKLGDVAEKIGRDLVPIVERLADVVELSLPVLDFAADHLNEIGIALGVIIAARAAPAVLLGVAGALEKIGAAAAGEGLLNLGIRLGAIGRVAGTVGLVAWATDQTDALETLGGEFAPNGPFGQGVSDSIGRFFGGIVDWWKGAEDQAGATDDAAVDLFATLIEFGNFQGFGAARAWENFFSTLNDQATAALGGVTTSLAGARVEVQKFARFGPHAFSEWSDSVSESMDFAAGAFEDLQSRTHVSARHILRDLRQANRDQQKFAENAETFLGDVAENMGPRLQTVAEELVANLALAGQDGAAELDALAGASTTMKEDILREMLESGEGAQGFADELVDAIAKVSDLDLALSQLPEQVIIRIIGLEEGTPIPGDPRDPINHHHGEDERGTGASTSSISSGTLRIDWGSRTARLEPELEHADRVAGRP